MRSLYKPQSITSETRVSNSNLFNNSYLMNTSAPELNNMMSNKIKESENKELEFVRQKNYQLNERVKKMTLVLKQMEDSNRVLLEMNRKYVQVVNKYYENQNKKIESQVKKRNSVMNNIESGNSPFQQQNFNHLNEPKNEAHRLLEQLEKDHRNLTKHCLVMEEEIKNYNTQIIHYNQMKDQLFRVNHTSVKQLIQELEELSQQNKNLKKQNNLITYQLQKYKFQHNNLQKKQTTQQKQAGNSQQQLAKMKSILSTVKQESQDKSKIYESRIYELQLKVQKLQAQLRGGQQNVYKSGEQRKDLVMKHVEQVHEYQKLRKSYKQLQNAIGNKNRARCFSMNPKKNNISMYNIFENDVNTINQLNGVNVHKNRREKMRKQKKNMQKISVIL